MLCCLLLFNPLLLLFSRSLLLLQLPLLLLQGLLLPLFLQSVAAYELYAVLQQVALLHQLLDKGLLSHRGVCCTLVCLQATPSQMQHGTAQYRQHHRRRSKHNRAVRLGYINGSGCMQCVLHGCP
jgi:hypothetical protein